jgi:hypothetical protein
VDDDVQPVNISRICLDDDRMPEDEETQVDAEMPVDAAMPVAAHVPQMPSEDVLPSANARMPEDEETQPQGWLQPAGGVHFAEMPVGGFLQVFVEDSEGDVPNEPNELGSEDEGLDGPQVPLLALEDVNRLRLGIEQSRIAMEERAMRIDDAEAEREEVRLLHHQPRWDSLRLSHVRKVPRRSYITGIPLVYRGDDLVDAGHRMLIVEVSNRMTVDYQVATFEILEQIEAMNLSRDDALNLRTRLLSSGRYLPGISRQQQGEEVAAERARNYQEYERMQMQN